MTLVVPFDGSELSEAALVRAVEFGSVLEEDVLALTVIPRRNAEYAREHGWIDEDEEFDVQSVVSDLHEQVTDLCPSADYRHETVGRYASSGQIALKIRKIAKKEDATMVFVGSENAGHMVSSLSSVASSVTAEEAYDVTIVRHRAPARIKKLKEASPHVGTKSNFYLAL